ncbi:MAG: hypothetical protein R2932_00035 [Caldilineaceae bacterium]
MTQMQLELTARVQPGTLPRLRFGQEYRFRVRTVDLAGNGLTVDEATKLAANFAPAVGGQLPTTANFFYGRFEPVTAPVLTPRRRYGEGESLERLVIRSNVGQSSTEYAAQHPQYPSVNERHVAAPKTSQYTVEAHGLLDPAFDTLQQGLSPEEARPVIAEMYEIARREKGSLNDTTLDPAVEFIRTGSDPASTEGYTIHGQTQLELPYLPDPLAEGVVFWGLPGVPTDEGFVISYATEPWYNARPFRLQLTDGNDLPIWDGINRVLTIALPQAAVLPLRMSSTMPDGSFTTMGLWRWFEEQNAMTPLPNFDELAEAVAHNRHWLFTPWRDLTLVHAVQQPLEAPTLDLLSTNGALTRNWTATQAIMQGNFIVHAASTAKVDLLATWREPSDRNDSVLPLWGNTMQTLGATVFSFTVPQLSQAFPTIEPHLLEMQIEGDELIRVSFDIILYYQEWRAGLQQQLAAAATTRERRAIQAQFDLLEQIKPHEFNDTKYREVRYQLTATSRFREYFDQAAIQAGHLDITQQGNTVVLKVLSSAPPAAPKVSHVIPTWRWEEEQADNVIKRRRVGGSVRVYLERPWFSSGEGELLGVVLGREIAGASVSIPSDADYPYISHFGRDPIRQSAGLPTPGPTSFTNAVQTIERVPLAELGRNSSVAVVAFAPDFAAENDHFVAESNRWYCDIAMDTAKAYYPFVRLALVRYQPNAIPGAFLSPVVLADFVQTVPDRTLQVTADGGNPGEYTIQVSGPTYLAVRSESGNEEAQSSEIERLLQRRNLAITDELLGWEEVADSRQILALALTGDGATAEWLGSVTIPALPADELVRLVVEEYELFMGDASQPDEPPGKVRRLVYTDYVILPM